MGNRYGIFVLLAVVLLVEASKRCAKREGIEPRHVSDPLFVAGCVGIVSGRIWHYAVYDPSALFESPELLLEFWREGHGILGTVAGVVAYLYWYVTRLKTVPRARFFGCIFFVLPWAQCVGRIGCFLAQDHPGTESNFFLAVLFPDGTRRHDLGLYEAILLAFLGATFLLQRRRRVPIELFLPLWLVGYAILRFSLDFLRVGEARYWGLTPSQHLSIAMFTAGWIGAHRIAHSQRSVRSIRQGDQRPNKSRASM